MLSLQELKRQFGLIRDRQSSLRAETDEDIFAIWVLLALATTNEQAAAEAICGGPFDGGIDAVFVDANAVWIVQSKLRREPGQRTETAASVREFARIANHLVEPQRSASSAAFWTSLKRNPRDAHGRAMRAAREACRGDKPIRFVFASTGKFARALEAEGTKLVRSASKRASLTLLDHRAIAQLLANYIRDVAPAVPNLTLRVVSGELRAESMGDSRLKAWTIATTAKEVAGLQNQGGEQVFARNIRFGLGDKKQVNAAIRTTLLREPERFWFLNNGLTIACDSARLEDDHVVMQGAQIINGQQTTRTIAAVVGSRRASAAHNARVAVRIISFESVPANEADRLIEQVVEATNFQNAISKADLRSNDPRQIELARALASRGYLFVRKRGRQDAPSHLSYLKRKVKRSDLFAAVAGAMFDSVALREGQTPLFDSDKRYYDAVLDRKLNFQLSAWYCWRRANALARRSPEWQAAKFLVHFHAFSHLRDELGRRLEDFVNKLELRDRGVERALDRCLEQLFRAATVSYRRHRVDDGSALPPKPYHQRETASDHFASFWRSRDAAPMRERLRGGLRALSNSLDG